MSFKKKLVIQIEKIVYKISNKVIFQKNSKAKLRFTCKFLKIELNENEASNNFKTVYKQCFKNF